MCPKALQETHVGRSGRANLRVECVSNLDLHIGHLSFGFPGMLNALNILKLSPLFPKVLAGTFPPVKQTYKVAENIFDLPYYLTDGIYSRRR
jgi:Plant transposon protein